jgi:hypothetical protein
MTRPAISSGRKRYSGTPISVRQPMSTFTRSTESERKASDVLERIVLGDLFANLFVPRTTSEIQESVN